jgi:glycosyltransferase A (GT-A) superfamily protein (DUF2064 family)
MASSALQGSIVVVAKCPIRGQSKTRLIPLLGQDGSVALARAMLSDVLLSIDKCGAFSKTYKILLYAPGTQAGLDIMKDILQQQLGLSVVEGTRVSADSSSLRNPVDETRASLSSWILVPMKEGDLTASDLGTKLEDGLIVSRNIMKNGRFKHIGGVVFLGMDAPILNLDDIALGLYYATTGKIAKAVLCPAMDGGYGMLCVPPNADPSRTFSNLFWSHSLTAVSQIKALTDQNIMVTIGKVMQDIDEPSDVEKLCRLLQKKNNYNDNLNLDDEKILGYSNVRYPSCIGKQYDFITTKHPSCYYTHRALVDAKLLQ